MKEFMIMVVIVATACLVTFGLTGCNTVQGIKDDITGARDGMMRTYYETHLAE